MGMDALLNAVLAPDFATPFVAWRTWALSRHAGRTRLRSVLKSTVWEPRAPLEARCLRVRLLRRFRPHPAPRAECACGIYAANLETAASYLGDPQFGGTLPYVHHVVGRVALWGDVVECERGYRATFAYPQHIYVAGRTLNGEIRRDADTVAAALRAYDVPVTLADLDEVRLLAALGAPGELGAVA